MQYYMHINGQQVGPFDESLLMLNGLTPTTPVWADGMTGGCRQTKWRLCRICL